MSISETDIQDVLDRYFPEPCDWSAVNRAGSGTNNSTRFIALGGREYVLRLYETHRDTDKVRYEHAVLSALAEMSLPFGTPVPIRALNGNTFVTLTSDAGKIAALFACMEGENPAFRHEPEIRSFGETAALLSAALGNLAVPLPPVYSPYYDVNNIHPSCPPEKLLEFCEQTPPPFSSLKDKLHAIGDQYKYFCSQIPMLEQLPHRLVHGDLNRTNLLSDREGHITAVLDFEFVTEDLRVMEMAVSLTDLLDAERPDDGMWRRISAFLDGYFAHTVISRAEAEAVPLLVVLRRLDVFVHFLGRYWDGVNSAELVMSTAESLYGQLSASAETLNQLRLLLLERSTK